MKSDFFYLSIAQHPRIINNKKPAHRYTDGYGQVEYLFFDCTGIVSEEYTLILLTMEDGFKCGV